MTSRGRVLDVLARQVPASRGRCCLVGIDGPDGAGKSTFADGLIEAVLRLGRPAARVSCDDFHHVQAVRYRRGRDSPEGYWLDSFDYERFTADVLVPLQTRHRFRPRSHDLDSDQTVHPPWQDVAEETVVIVDGVFLHRDELAWAWDLSVFLDVPFEITAARMAERDGSPPDPTHPAMRRYVEGQLMYFSRCDPQARATVLIDNSDHASPRVIRGPGNEVS